MRSFKCVLLLLAWIDSFTGLRVPTAERGASSNTSSIDTHVFVAGLEGTGHEFFTQLWKNCFSAKACVAGTNDFYNALFKKSPFLGQIWMKQARELRSNSSTLVPMNCVTKKMSYPYMRAHNNPDIEKLVHIASMANHSVKILVTVRHPVDVLASDARNWHRKEQDLVDSLKVLTKQLKRIPKDAFRCVPYGMIPAVGHALSTFLGVDMDIEGAWQEEFRNSGCAAKAEADCTAAPLLEAAQHELLSTVCAGLDPPRLDSKINILRDNATVRKWASGVAQWLFN
eukprot:gnl/TRDRNA2_/TRDRNA2_39044_c0_seq1.p1 gnl/TRDRNA2_/TRDRNA2_39044_c0~~gnl/TRDRNA2_/TRDRNA2_39044_c0_seq1.p1  ORF type:complete len:284 (-),score=27.92 gnl/TRDRNA2_/TRDRNA2_39044_c0_seq1:25-876(-)